MTRKVYVVEWRCSRPEIGLAGVLWEPYRLYMTREDAEAQLAQNDSAAIDRRIRVYVPRKAVRHD